MVTHQKNSVLASLRCWMLVCSTTGLMCGCRPDDAPPAAESPSSTVEWRLVVSGDTRGWLMPCGCTSNQSGGLLRRGTYVRQLGQQPPLVLVDVGGAADGTSAYQLEKLKYILQGEVLMGVEAHNVGGTEIAFGLDTLKALQAHTGIVFLSTNIVDSTGHPPFPMFLTRQVGGRTVLLTGVAPPQENIAGVTIREPKDALVNLLSTIDVEYDWLVVLADLDETGLRQLAMTLPEADVIVGGRTQQSLAPEWVGPTLLTSATNKGKFLAEVTFGGTRRNNVSARIVEMSPDYPDDPAQRDNLFAFRKQLAIRDFRAEESGLVDVPSDLRDRSEAWTIAGTNTCRDCHQLSHEIWGDSGHAHAWERLVDEGAHVDPYCQQCHTTGYGFDSGFQSLKTSTERVNVGCESCHGPSLAHASDSTQPTTLDARGQCLSCHDPENSPAFQYEPYWERIAHGE